MDPGSMRAMMESMMQGDGKNLPTGVDGYGMEQMMNMMKQVEKDPELKKQMEGYWKMLDNMNEQDPNAYKKHIDE
jgi:hypothetical protein